MVGCCVGAPLVRQRIASSQGTVWWCVCVLKKSSNICFTCANICFTCANICLESSNICSNFVPAIRRSFYVPSKVCPK